MASLRLPVGERIRYYRMKNGNRKQAAIAGLCGITERYLSQIENGKAVPSLDVLAALAAELGVPLSSLLSERPEPEPAPAATTAPTVVRALLNHGPTPDSPPATAASLRERVEDAWRIWQTSETRFTDAESVLPSLITDTEHALSAPRSGTDAALLREVRRTAADLYGLLRSYCRRTGRLDLSLLASDRAMKAADDADDPIRIAAARWNLGHVLLSHKDGAGEAFEVAVKASNHLKEVVPETSERAALVGALELVSVVADARRHRWWEARERIEKQVAPLSERAGEGNVMWTVFGPTNVHLHALSIEMLAGESTEGLRVADKVDISRLPSRERRWTFTLEVARCYDQRRDDAAVFVHLLDLEQLSREDMMRSQPASDLVTGLLHRARPTYRPQVTKLAERLGYV